MVRTLYLDFKDVKEFMDELKGLLKDLAKKMRTANHPCRFCAN